MAHCLRIIEVKVKPEVLRGSNVDLRCVFDSDGDRIYSVKWYKGSHEFFRYLPEGPVRFQIFSWSNFTIDVSTVNNFFFLWKFLALVFGPLAAGIDRLTLSAYFGCL